MGGNALIWFFVSIALALVVSAAEAKPRGAPGPTQIFYNIVSDGGASCADNHVNFSATVNSTLASPTVTISGNTLNAGDINKTIRIPGSGGGGGVYVGTITNVTGSSPNTVTVSPVVNSTQSATQTVTYGTDDAPAFTTFNTWALANQGSDKQVVLTVPSGKTCWFGSSTTMFRGINNLIVEGTGATFSSADGSSYALGAGLWNISTGGGGVCQRGLAATGGCSARIQTVSAGASTVTLTAASYAAGYISRFSVGKWVMIGGMDQQGLWNSPYGFPQNLRYFEWRQVTAICNNTGPCTGSATVTFDQPLTNSYLDTWPQWNAGGTLEADQGGPAAIFAMSDQWNTTQEYRGLTLTQSGQIYNNGRFITYRNMTVTGTGGNCGPVPSQNVTWSDYNSNWSTCVMETDKLVGTMTIDGSTLSRIDFQSSSTDQFTLANATVTTIFGTPTRTTISDTSIQTFRPGAFNYGASGAVSCLRCNVTSFSNTGGATTPQGGSPFNPSMSSGVFSFPNVDETGPNPTGSVFVPPNGNVYWVATGVQSIGLFNVQTMTQDATNAYVQTNEAGGLPGISGGITGLRTHPAPQWTCTDPNSASDPVFKATCTNDGATPLAPLWDYGKRSYAPSAQGNIGAIQNRGRVVSLTVDVTVASTHTGSIMLNAASQFNNRGTIKQSDWTAFLWGPQINLKQAGVRVITPSGWTCDTGGGPVAGGCSGDVTTGAGALPEAVWSHDGILPYVAGSFSGGVNPQFTMTFRTDQGVVP